MSQLFNVSTDTTWRAADKLIYTLRFWGIEYLVGLEGDSTSTQNEQMPPLELIKHLAQQQDNSRIRDASISLFLLHPELEETILHAIATSAPTITEQIITSTLATLYLQQTWSVRLALAFGHRSYFPERPSATLWEQRQLPPPAFYNGEVAPEV